MEAHHTLFPVRGGEQGLNRTIVNTAAIAGAAYMGFRLIKLVNYWNRGEVSDLDPADALALSTALHASPPSASNGFDALDLPFGQQYSSWMSSSNIVASPNPTFQRRLKQLSRQTLRGGRGNTSLPSTPRANMFFGMGMGMPLDVGINSLLCGLNSPDESKAIVRVNTLKFDKQLQAFGLEVMKSQTEQSLKSVSELDAKCLVKLVSTHYAQQDEELFMKLITAISNCSTFKNNQDSLREAGCLEALWDLLKSSAPETIKSVVVQAMSNLAVNEANQQFLKDCIPDILDALASANYEGLQLNCLTALLNLSVLPQNHVKFPELGMELLFSKFDAAAQSTDNEKLQALKVLVNLSCNEESIPRLLNAKVPPAFLRIYLNPAVTEAILLRHAVFLRNILRYAAAHVECLSICAHRPDSLGSSLSSGQIMCDLHARSTVIAATTANQELRGISGDILGFSGARQQPELAAAAF
ncbi:hypothetical protein BV898_17274 [Hypsibius exemplaris]|uniref:Armadillo repeat-containing domain-containing protein n=1 Tax=Hypsibius exemplaris TaxID=2072580 RepID=A0A9X6NF21_HYPEX|nr:hypothetical protein BV898_17274 [Hypsibius exemplaris]